MAIGTGIILGVIGAILLTGAIGLPEGWPVDSEALGWILLIAGIVALVLSLTVNRQRGSRPVD